jgi:hypothetical protein
LPDESSSLAAANFAAAIWSGIDTADALCPSFDADAGDAAASAMVSGVTGSGTGATRDGGANGYTFTLTTRTRGKEGKKGAAGEL